MKEQLRLVSLHRETHQRQHFLDIHPALPSNFVDLITTRQRLMHMQNGSKTLITQTACCSSHVTTSHFI